MGYSNRAAFFAACGLSSGISVFAQQTQPEEDNSTLKWKVDTQSPLGGLGANVGPAFTKLLSPVSSLTARATVGGSVTFAEDPVSGDPKLAFSPTAKGDAAYHRSFLNDRIKTSAGLSAAYLKVDDVFYGVGAIKGVSANLKGGLRLTPEANVFAESKVALTGNLPDIKTTGITFTPFVRTIPSLEGVQISFSRSVSQFNHGDKQNMTFNAMVAGYAWGDKGEKNGKKEEKGNSYFAGFVCVGIASNKANGNSAKGQSCLPWASMTINLD